MTVASGRRGLLVAGLLVLALAVLLDLLSNDSLVRSAWMRLTPDRRTPVQERIDDIRRTRERPVRP